MDLLLELGAECGPVALQVVAQVVVVVLEILRHGAIDLPGREIPQLRRIAVPTHRPVGRLPDRELLARARVAAQHGFVLALLADADAHPSVDLDLRRDVIPHPFGDRVHEGVGVAVDVGDLVAPEVHGIGIEHPGAAEEVGVVHLEREGLPAPGRAACEQPRPWRANHPEVLLQVGHELLEQRIAVGAVVRRVHGVGVVEVRRRVLKRHRDQLRKVGRVPRPVKLEAGFARGLLESRGAVARRFRHAVGRETEGRPEIEVPLLVHRRVAARRVGVIAARQQHRRPEVHRVAPPGGEDVALDPDVFHPLGVLRELDRGKRAGELQTDRIGARRVEMHLPHVADQVSGSAVELLALPLVVVQPQGVSVGAVKLGVDVDERLHVIVTRGDVAQAREGIAEGRAVDDRGCSRGELRDVHPEERDAIAFATHLEPGLDVGVAGHEDVHAPGEGCGAQRRRHADLDSGRLGRDGRWGGEQGDHDASDGVHSQSWKEGRIVSPGRAKVASPAVARAATGLYICRHLE